MKWPRSSKAHARPPLLGPVPGPLNPDLNDIRKYARDVVERVHAQGVKALDWAASQESYEWSRALTELGRAYNEAAATYLTICDRLGYLPDPLGSSSHSEQE
jgi:hypothetical protein